MKKLLSIIVIAAVLAATLIVPTASAESKPYTITYTNITGWNLRLARPLESVMTMQGSHLFIYMEEAGYIPYVLVELYNFKSEEEFMDALTEAMRDAYADLKVVSPAHKTVVGGKECYEIRYTYTIQGYLITDRRIAITHDGRTFEFGSVELEELNQTVGNLLEDMLQNSAFYD